MRPVLETRRSYIKRSPSTSPCNRRSPSPVAETMYNRTDSPSNQQQSRNSDSSDGEQHKSSSNTKKQKRSSRSKYRTYNEIVDSFVAS
jgi:hypothetical protein